jgi:hypothetical protein
MKTLSRNPKVALAFISMGLMIGALGCSSEPKQSPGEGAENLGAPPVVLNPRAEPKQVNLNEKFEVSRPIDVFADVKSFNSSIDKVKLRLSFAPETEEKMKFFKNPVEVKMERLSGTTWKAHLDQSQLRKLAINGQSLKYRGQVYAQNDRGQITVSGQPVEITIKASPAMEGTS